MYSAAISRRDLRHLERGGYFSGLANKGRLADGPDSARARIREQCGSVPDLFGTGCPPFERLRALVSAPLKEAGLLDAVLIAAPHTHWGPRAIVHKWDATYSCYEIGAIADVVTRGRLLPVAFVFSDEGLTPTEWCASHGDLGGSDYFQTLKILADLNPAVRTLEASAGFCCFGLALNYRFKALREPSLFPTIEAPCENRPIATVRIDTNVNYSDRTASTQVAWQLREVPTLSNAQLEVLSFVSQRLSGLAPQFARKVFAALVAGAPATH